MKLLGTTSLVLMSSLLLTACGYNDSVSDSVTSNAPVGPVDPVKDSSGSNRPPVLSGTPLSSVDEGATYVFAPVAYDPDGDDLVFSVENLPSWASFDVTSGKLSGTPDYESAGTYSDVTIHASDGNLSDTLPAFDIVVHDVADGGTGVVSPPVAQEKAPVLMSALVSGDSITLSWTQDGLIPDGGYDVFVDGVDTNSQYRTTSLSARISGLDLSVTHCFNVESRYVAAGAFYPSNQVCSQAQVPENSAPSIAGTPSATVLAGTQYSFTPSVSDPENDPLTFTVTNLPSWASFDSQTGTLSGQPMESDLGVYADIDISVSDGEFSVSLGAFALEVQSASVATGSLSLSWLAPSTRADNSTLEPYEIAGYNIYLGETPDSLTLRVDLNDGGVSSYTLNDLPVGTYYVAVTAYDLDGLSSGYSNTLQVTVSN